MKPTDKQILNVAKEYNCQTATSDFDCDIPELLAFARRMIDLGAAEELEYITSVCDEHQTKILWAKTLKARAEQIRKGSNHDTN